MQISGILQKLGRDVEAHPPNAESSAAYRAMIQPLRYKNKMYLYGVNTEIGFNSQGYYLYIGPPEQDLTTATDEFYLSADGEKFQVERAEKVYLRGDLLYVWAILRAVVE